jgi:hypothetical protein
MESSLMSGSDVATLGAAPAHQDVRRRWLMLAAALVVGLVAAFAIGTAIKKTPAPAPTGSLAPSSSASGQHASITPLTNAGAVPALHAPAAKPKAKPKTPTTSSSSGTSSSVAGSSVSSTPTQSSGSTQSSAPTQSSTPTQSSGTGGGSGSSGTTGVSHSGGGLGGGGGAG